MTRSRIPLPPAARFALPLCLALLLLAVPAAAKDKKKKKAAGATNGEVAGVVIDGNGEKLEGIEVTLTMGPDGATAGSAVTDKKGEFELTVQVASEEDAAAAAEAEKPVIGKYELRLFGEGYAPFVNELDLTAGERLDVEVTMLDAAAGIRNEAINAYNVGVQLHSADKLDEAAAKFREAIEIDPSVAEPYLGLADVAIARTKPEEGLEAIETYRKLKPDEEAGKRLAYEIYRALGRMDEAKALAADLGIEAADKDLAIQVFNQGAVASQQGNQEEALAKFEHALKLDPTLGPAWAGLASIFYNQRELEKAVEPAAKAVELQPEHEQSRRIQFLVLDGLGVPESADAWEAYRQMNQPAALELLYLRADLDFRNNDTAAAETAAQRILTLDADFAKAHLLLGKIFASSDAAKAKAHLQKVVALAPEGDPDRELAQEMIGYLE